MGFGHLREACKPCGEIGVFAGLHEAEVAFGKHERCVARNRSHHGNAEHGDGVADQSGVSRTADPIEDDAGDPYCRIVSHETAQDGGGRLRLCRDVEHQQHRQAIARGEVSACACPPPVILDTVEQTHRAFHDDDVGAACLCHQLIEQVGGHRPAIEIDAGRTRCRRVKGGIDEVGAGLGGADAYTALLQGGEQAQRHRGLADAGARR